MLTSVQQLNYAIVLCDDLETMKAFYRDLFAFPVASETETGLTFRAGDVLLSLRKRTRYYDGSGVRAELPRRATRFSGVAGRSGSVLQPTRCQRGENPGAAY